ncbi:TPA: hypothetical protein ACKRMY_006366 [Pseudomonas aeruginosa]
MINLPAVLREPHIDIEQNSQLQELQDENCLLFDQLQVVQEELERRHSQAKVASDVALAVAVPATVINITPVDERLIEVQAENLRWQAIVKAQDDIHTLQTRYALANQLGDILIEGSRSTGSMLSVPARLHRAWRQNRREDPPASLGGKTFSKVLSVYQDGGEAAVESLLSQTSVSTATQASAWTAVARTQLYTAPALVADMARRAYALEPRPFRQKWLAFRLHEAGELLEAEALLELLPEDIKFSESEERQAHRLKSEARQYRLDHVWEMHEYGDQQAEYQRQWQDLAQSRDAQVGQVEQLSLQLVSLREELETLKQERERQSGVLSQLYTQCEALQSELVATSHSRDQHSVLAAQECARNELLEAEAKSLKSLYEDQKDLVTQWFEQCVSLQTGIAELIQAREEQVVLAEHQQSHIEGLRVELKALQQLNEEQAEQWRQQRIALQDALGEVTQVRDEQALLVEQQHSHIEGLQAELGALKQSNEEQAEQWCQQRVALQNDLGEIIQAREELAVLAAQRLTQCELLRSESEALTQAHDEQKRLATQLQNELQQTRTRLELEKVKAEQSIQLQELERLLAEQRQELCVQMQTVVAQQPAFQAMVEGMLKKQAEELDQARRHIEAAVKSNSINAVRQVQSFVGMQQYFNTGVLPAFNSEGHSWPVSADFALFLMQRLVLERYDLVIEFGSGMSTVVIAKTLSIIAEHAQTHLTPFVSFDHLDLYYQKTSAYLRHAGLNNAVELMLKPLQDWGGAPDDQIYPYYSCEDALAKRAQDFGASVPRVLVIVDGPPAATGPQARYPAAPMVVKHFPTSRIDFVMDDYVRNDEKEVVQHWLADMKAIGLESAVSNFKFEKGACLFTVHPKDEKVK